MTRPPRLKVALDTSCLVPLFVDNGFQDATRAECERLRRQNALFVVATHALLECFSVLTRMPPPYRVDPETAERLLLENFSQDAEIPPVGPELLWSSIRELVSQGMGGGKVYDAVIARASFHAGATVLLTWNVRDLLSVAPEGLDVLTPPEHATRAPRLH